MEQECSRFPQAPRLRLLLGVLLCGLLPAPALADDSNGNNGAKQTCDQLSGQRVAGAMLGTTTLVAATATVPEFCKVPGFIPPQLNFELRLPTIWNKKVHFSGNGGTDGDIPAPNANALSKGFVDMAADGGHHGTGLDFIWALHDPLAVEMFGHLYIPTVMATGLEIVKAHYGKGPTESYFEGCSTGGREALMMAQRYPLLFDGIIGGDPIFNYVGGQGSFNVTAIAIQQPGAVPTAGKVATVANAVLAACDFLDGLADGIVSNPQACHFDPATLRCAGGADLGDNCLSDPQLTAVKTLTGVSSFAGGAYQNIGPALNGNESYPGIWAFFTGPASGNTFLPRFSATYLISDGIVKYYLARDPNLDSINYVWDSNPAALFGLAASTDATNPDLRPFEGAGGKLIIWSGGSDIGVSARNVADYYQKAVSAVGGQIVADHFMRLYLPPGVGHCGGGPGAAPVDLLAALDAWVVKGNAPEALPAAKKDSTGQILLTRPLCPFPQYPRYNGSGDVNAASSFSCAAP